MPRKKIKPPKPRNAMVLPMTLNCKASSFKDRRAPRGGAKAEDLQEEYQEILTEEVDAETDPGYSECD